LRFKIERTLTFRIADKTFRIADKSDELADKLLKLADKLPMARAFIKKGRILSENPGINKNINKIFSTI
jgi:hypothetical protein